MGKSSNKEPGIHKKNNQRTVALVTGCSSELGRAIAEEFSKKGYSVYGSARNKKDLEALGNNITPVQLDIAEDVFCSKAIDYIVKKEGRIDILVNCAGLTISGPTIDFSSENFLSLLNTNAVGAFRLIKLVVPIMRQAGGGRIINITSLNGLLSLPNFGLYSASKFALEALGTAFYYELAKDHIFVTNIAPGAIEKKAGVSNNFSHKPAREKLAFLKILLPMLTADQVVKNIVEVVEKNNPPLHLVLGRDAWITNLLNRISIFGLWEKMMLFVWNKK